jgi:SAM-dependent methyltransferase
MDSTLDQHQREIEENREHWRRKPLLRRVYAQFYRDIAARIKPEHRGLIIELGSGMGNVKEHIPDCITTDVFPNPWLDRVENAYGLTFGDQTVGHLILFDVWHHIRYPGEALREFSRVLAHHGRIVIFDHAMGFLGKYVVGAFHHEPLGLENDIEWTAGEDFRPDNAGYYAAQGNASRIFTGEKFKAGLGEWEITEIKYYSGLAYLGTGGFRGPQLYPTALLPFFNSIDSVLSKFPSLSSRMLLVLDKK